ncbi:TVP38/TMEM64 family protein [Cereibacter azotoformans]|uniref:TVP38/TMEM64 family membrane protein n=1 Tax=Cereibacter azotoformans TaxID=43057 RepID=A0A2T5JT68_9RHOB|nr:TVP38/TMEM64 family protein [Cereibacter azotoformans]AXQ95709.1 TVP38/TMEM64 family protein [Cereibacter sphaeroides]PTR13002.1 putative membrane protein YdjX (TVP38/TMEM64 family) [Cereibacter azotoformans]UIJ32794.1 TVP38/TMEM64 family protein [Cereibacter azotoformans]
MHVNVGWRAAALAVLPLAAGGIAYVAIPGVPEALHRALAILTTSDVTEAVAALRDYLGGFGIWAPVVSAALMVFQSIAAPIPAFLLTFTNGLLFGWAWGAALSWSSAMLGAALCFWLSRAFGRPAVEKLAGGSRALDTADLFFERYGSASILIARLLPFVSFDIISYAAGLTPVSFRRFLLATGVGQLPATLLYSYLGQSVTGSIRALFWLFSITVVIAIIGWLVGPKLFTRPANGGIR